MNKFLDKKFLLTVASLACGVGTLIIGAAQKKSDANEMAEKAAKIVMDKMSKTE